MIVKRTIEALPPIYAIRCAETGAYLGGWLTAERRDAAIVARGWVEDGVAFAPEVV